MDKLIFDRLAGLELLVSKVTDIIVEAMEAVRQNCRPVEEAIQKAMEALNARQDAILSGMLALKEIIEAHENTIQAQQKAIEAMYGILDSAFRATGGPGLQTVSVPAAQVTA